MSLESLDVQAKKKKTFNNMSLLQNGQLTYIVASFISVNEYFFYNYVNLFSEFHGMACSITTDSAEQNSTKVCRYFKSHTVTSRFRYMTSGKRLDSKVLRTKTIDWNELQDVWKMIDVFLFVCKGGCSADREKLESRMSMQSRRSTTSAQIHAVFKGKEECKL